MARIVRAIERLFVPYLAVIVSVGIITIIAGICK